MWWKPVYRHCSPNSRDLCSGVVPDVCARWPDPKYGSMGQDWRRSSRYWFLAKHQILPPPWTWIETGDFIRSRLLHYFGTLSFWLASCDMNQYGPIQLHRVRDERILLIPMTAIPSVLSRSQYTKRPKSRRDRLDRELRCRVAICTASRIEVFLSRLEWCFEHADSGELKRYHVCGLDGVRKQ
jgi:hypothetical protein